MAETREWPPIYFWRINAASDWIADAEREGLSWLGADEQARLAQRSSEEGRRAFLVSRWLTRLVLGRVTGLHPAALTFTIGRNGKPECAALRALGLAYNLSHTQDATVLLVARAQAVGIDLEDGWRGAQALRVGAAFFAEEEQARLASLPRAEAEALAVRLWTVKECVAKAFGGTVWQALDQVSLSPDGATLSIGRVPGWRMKGQWQVAAGPLDDCRHLALCMIGDEPVGLDQPAPILDPSTGEISDHWSPDRSWRPV